MSIFNEKLIKIEDLCTRATSDIEEIRYTKGTLESIIAQTKNTDYKLLIAKSPNRDGMTVYLTFKQVLTEFKSLAVESGGRTQTLKYTQMDNGLFMITLTIDLYIPYDKKVTKTHCTKDDFNF